MQDLRSVFYQPWGIASSHAAGVEGPYEWVMAGYVPVSVEALCEKEVAAGAYAEWAAVCGLMAEEWQHAPCVEQSGVCSDGCACYAAYAEAHAVTYVAAAAGVGGAEEHAVGVAGALPDGKPGGDAAA